MNILSARAYTRQFAKDADDSSRYSDDEIDRAILYAGHHFCRSTRAVRRTDSVSLTANSSTFTLTNPLLYGFRPERIIDVYLDGQPTPLALVDYTDLNASLANDSSTGVPSILAFSDPATGIVWKTPDVAYTARLRYWQPFAANDSTGKPISWEAGHADDGSAVINLPDDLLIPVLVDGACAVLKFPSKEAEFASAGWARFLAFEQKFMGSGNLGARVVFRQPIDDAPRVLRQIKETFV